MEFHQIIVVHLNGHQVLKLLDSMVDLSNLVVFEDDLEDLATLEKFRI